MEQPNPPPPRCVATPHDRVTDAPSMRRRAIRVTGVANALFGARAVLSYATREHLTGSALAMPSSVIGSASSAAPRIRSSST